MIELPLLVCLLVALLGIVSGAVLWYRNGITTGVAIRFGLALPLLVLVTVMVFASRGDRKRDK